MKTFDIDPVFDALDRLIAIEKGLTFTIKVTKRGIELIPSKGFTFKILSSRKGKTKVKLEINDDRKD